MIKDKTITIDRKKWLRGKTDANSALLKNGTMCCLGFLSLACGLKSKQIQGIATVPGVIKERQNAPQELQWLYKKSPLAYKAIDSEDARILMICNDNPKSTDAHKEKIIKKYFKKHGFVAKFIN